MTHLLDTSVCVEYLRGGANSSVANQLRQHDPCDIVLCSVVKAELLYGALRSQQPDKHLEKLQKFVSRFESLVFDDSTAETCARIRQHLATRGTPIGPYDLLIAATAQAHGLILVTHNLDEFSRIPGLGLEDWTTT